MSKDKDLNREEIKALVARQNFLLTKLAEECMELGHMALKLQQFGALERHHKSKDNNLVRTTKEMLDVVAVTRMLKDEFNIDLPNVLPESDIERYISNKRKKINKYYDYSRQLGRIQ